MTPLVLGGIVERCCKRIEFTLVATRALWPAPPIVAATNSGSCDRFEACTMSFSRAASTSNTFISSRRLLILPVGMSRWAFGKRITSSPLCQKLCRGLSLLLVTGVVEVYSSSSFQSPHAPNVAEMIQWGRSSYEKQLTSTKPTNSKHTGTTQRLFGRFQRNVDARIITLRS